MTTSIGLGRSPDGLDDIAHDLEQAAAALRRAARGVEADGPCGPVFADSGRSGLAGVARTLYRERRRRDEILAPFGMQGSEPHWDVLLLLFIYQAEGRPAPVSAMCSAADGPPTTALRHLVRMTEAGLIRRTPDPGDRRRTYLSLTDLGDATLRRHLCWVAGR